MALLHKAGAVDPLDASLMRGADRTPQCPCVLIWERPLLTGATSPEKDPPDWKGGIGWSRCTGGKGRHV
jgi:hypothetical protein